MLFKRNYYYTVAGLPDLLLDEGRTKTDLAFFRAEFENSLHPQDFALVKSLFLKYDNANLLNLLEKKNQDFADLSNYSRDFLEEQIKDPEGNILAYLGDFIVKFKSGDRNNPDSSWDTELDSDFYDFLQTLENDFLKSWFAFQLNFQNVTTALACRDHSISAENQLVGKDSITESILRSNSKDFGLSQDFPEIEKILAAWDSDTIIEREKILDQIKWDWIDECTFFHYFTIEKLLGFMLQLAMVERWMKLDQETGRHMFDQLLSKMGEGYALPEEFNLQYVKRK